jgi:predicted CXXCH cytochrome family protein
LVACLALAWGYDRPPVVPDQTADLAACKDCHVRTEDGGLGLKPEADCGFCHKEIAAQIRTARHKHPPVKGPHESVVLCLDCHTFHDSKTRFLPADPLNACLACHPESGKAGSHPVGVKNPKTGRPITCTSECHDPHGSSYRWSCRIEPGRALCISCHEDL